MQSGEIMLKQLLAIEATSGRNDKTRMLKELIIEHPWLTYYAFRVGQDDRVSTYIAKRPEAIKPEEEDGFSIFDLKALFENICNEELPRIKKAEWGDIAYEIERSYEEDEQAMIWRILTKDMTVGATNSSFNKALAETEWAGKIPQIINYDTVRVSNIQDSDINPESSWVGIKMDGANATFASKFISRNGNPIPLKHLEDALRMYRGDYAFFGELVSSDRQSSSGLVNSAIAKGHETDRDVNKLQFHVFDVLPLAEYEDIYNPNHPKTESDFGFTARQVLAEGLIEELNHPDVKFVEQHKVNSVEEVYALCDKFVTEGHEGIIWNDANMKFGITRSKKRARIKEILDGDFKIVGFKEHNKKEGHLGKFYIESRCGNLSCGVGSGMNFEQRLDFWNRQDELVGKTIKVKYNEVIPHASKPGHFSLFLPVLDTNDIIRLDKAVSDSLKEIDWGKKDRNKKKWLKTLEAA